MANSLFAIISVQKFVCAHGSDVDKPPGKSINLFKMYSGTSLLGTLWDLDFSPYYRGFLNSEVT